MSRRSRNESNVQRHGNIFSRDSGAMYVHVQRENGLAHHTMMLKPWQVQGLRVLTSKWCVVALGIVLGSWAYFAAEAARVPILTRQISHLEQDARRIDSLQKTLAQLQVRYEQVQQMLSAPATSALQPSAEGDHAHH